MYFDFKKGNVFFFKKKSSLNLGIDGVRPY